MAIPRVKLVVARYRHGNPASRARHGVTSSRGSFASRPVSPEPSPVSGQCSEILGGPSRAHDGSVVSVAPARHPEPAPLILALHVRRLNSVAVLGTRVNARGEHRWGNRRY